MRISDWSSDVCSSDLKTGVGAQFHPARFDIGFRKPASFIAEAAGPDQFRRRFFHHSIPLLHTEPDRSPVGASHIMKVRQCSILLFPLGWSCWRLSSEFRAFHFAGGALACFGGVEG